MGFAVSVKVAHAIEQLERLARLYRCNSTMVTPRPQKLHMLKEEF
jgi:hypothetical protein